MQNQLQGQFYSALRARNVFINQPDMYFYQGGSKTGMGYNEVIMNDRCPYPAHTTDAGPIQLATLAGYLCEPPGHV